MLSEESKKFFIKQHGMVWLVVLLIVQIIVTLCHGYYSHYMIDENEDEYQSYIEKYGGPLTRQKSDEIEAEYNRLLHQDSKKVKNSRERKAFQVIYHQYTYEKGLDAGFIYDYRGWQTLLYIDNTPYLLVISIILIVTMIYSVEYDSDMYTMLLTGKKSRYGCGTSKILLSVSISIFLGATFQFIKAEYLAVTVGLPYPLAPLDTLEVFNGTIWNMSLARTAVSAFFIRILGCMLMASCTALVIVLVKNRILTIVLCTLSRLIIDIVCGRSDIVYFLPLGLIKGCGYFYPSRYELVIEEDGLKTRCVFHAIERNQFITLITSYIIALVIISFASYCLFSKTRRLRMIAFLVVPFVLSGCGAISDTSVKGKIVIPYGEENHMSTVINGSKCDISIDFDNNTLIKTENDGSTERVLNNAFPYENSIDLVFVNGSKCYYLMENDEDSGIYIRCMDLMTNKDSYIYSDMKNNSEDFYNLLTSYRDEDSVEDSFATVSKVDWFFVADGRVIYMKDNCIRGINLKTSRQQVVADDVEDGDVTYENGVLKCDGRNFALHI